MLIGSFDNQTVSPDAGLSCCAGSGPIPHVTDIIAEGNLWVPIPHGPRPNFMKVNAKFNWP